MFLKPFFQTFSSILLSSNEWARTFSRINRPARRLYQTQTCGNRSYVAFTTQLNTSTSRENPLTAIKQLDYELEISIA